jgi:hypothetical protein
MTTGDNHKASDSQHRLSDQVSANTSNPIPMSIFSACELAAERIVQSHLACIAGSPGSGTDPAARAAAAHANLALYLGPEIACGPEAATIGEALKAFVRG